LARLQRGPEVLPGLGLAHPRAAGSERRVGLRRRRRRGRRGSLRGRLRRGGGLLLAGHEGERGEQGRGGAGASHAGIVPPGKVAAAGRRGLQRAPGSFLASESSIVNVSRAAACSASFLERPRARANSSVPTVTSTSKVLEWSGPS